MEAIRVLEKYYPAGSPAFEILMEHSLAVSAKAGAVAMALKLPPEDIEFIRQAAILHDIGIRFTNAPELGCRSDLPYLAHGYKGHELLVDEGFPKHALVCERHTGTGISLEEIVQKNLPLPLRPMIPVSKAEKIICYCDKFFSKDPGKLNIETPLEKVVSRISKFGAAKVDIFMEWHREFAT